MTRPARAAAFVLATVLVAGAPEAAEHGHRIHDPAASADEPRRDASLYQIDATFVDQTGARATLDAGRGHPVVISMFYASCPDACPLLIADIRRLEAAVPASVRNDLRVVLVTLDPARDTPAALRSLAAAHGVDAGRWRFLAGSDDTTRVLAAALGIRYRQLATGAISHSSVITLLDRDGNIVVRVEGTGRAVGAIAERLGAGARAAGRPTRE